MLRLVGLAFDSVFTALGLAASAVGSAFAGVAFAATAFAGVAFAATAFAGSAFAETSFLCTVVVTLVCTGLGAGSAFVGAAFAATAFAGSAFVGAAFAGSAFVAGPVTERRIYVCCRFVYGLANRA